MTKYTPDYFFELNNFEHASLFKNCTFVWEVFSQIERYLKTYPNYGFQINVPRGTFLENKDTIYIGKGTIIEPGAFIRGPCIIGKNCEIRHGAYIRGGVITGNHCVIGHSTEVKNSIFLDGAKAPHLSYVGNSVLGRNVNLGAGTILSNLRLNKKKISIWIDGQKYETNIQKLGAIIGDNCQLGVNANTNPGTLISPDSVVHPNINLCGFYDRGSYIKSQEEGRA